MNSDWTLLVDFAIILLLILGIWRFQSPHTARSGSFAAAAALLCAFGVVLCGNPIREPAIVVLALLAGGAVGCLVAMRVNMIEIPAMIAFQNGAGGMAAVLTSFVEMTRGQSDLAAVGRLSGAVGIIIGAATFSGSMVAAAKLAGAIRQTPIVFPKHGWILALTLAGVCALGATTATAAGTPLFYGAPALTLLSLILGAVFALKIGGADMPVLISFLNANSGLAGAFCGVVMQNRLLIACGATVAASGFILTYAMCQAMNRNLLKVFAAAGLTPETTVSPTNEDASAPVPPPFAEEGLESVGQPPLARAVEAARNAGKVIIIPGYGMALAHAQVEVVKLAERLKRMGKEVCFAIHPIAGRMPGHMHVLLAEADVDPDILFDLADINGEFPTTDLALIVGACDVVNPAAIHAAGTPISGMPILAAHEAKQVLVCNMDERPGYSGVENPLYAHPRTILLLGDAKQTLGQLLEALG